MNYLKIQQIDFDIEEEFKQVLSKNLRPKVVIDKSIDATRRNVCR